MAILAIDNLLNPSCVIEIPYDGFANTAFKRFGRAPAEFCFYLVRINGIATVMAWTVFDVGNEVAIAADMAII